MEEVGNAPCVNMVGATIGAGVGPNQGQYGLIIDALVSVRLVTATGDIISVSDESYPELFWAIRGAGTNFGIITYATYRVHDNLNNGYVVNADFTFRGSDNGSLWELIRSWDDNIAHEIGLAFTAGYNRTIEEVRGALHRG
jgi:fumiquinazoline A oxidase